MPIRWIFISTLTLVGWQGRLLPGPASGSPPAQVRTRDKEMGNTQSPGPAAKQDITGTKGSSILILNMFFVAFGNSQAQGGEAEPVLAGIMINLCPLLSFRSPYEKYTSS